MNVETRSTRRRVLGISSTAVVILAACKSSKPDDFKDNEDHTYPLKKQEPVIGYPRSAPDFDLPYINTILEQLQKERGTRDQRIQAVKGNLAYRETALGGGTALMLDESGYYFSHSAAFGSLPGGIFRPIAQNAVVYSPRFNLLTPVKQFIIDQNLGVAVFFAPTGNPRHIVDHLQINFRELSNKQRIAVFGLQGSGYLALDLALRKGDTDRSRTATDYQNLIVVSGLKYYGGISGAPGLDTEGKIVAIASGVWPEGVSTPTDSQGITVSQVMELRRILNSQKPKVFLLPINRN